MSAILQINTLLRVSKYKHCMCLLFKDTNLSTFLKAEYYVLRQTNKQKRKEKEMPNPKQLTQYFMVLDVEVPLSLCSICIQINSPNALKLFLVY